MTQEPLSPPKIDLWKPLPDREIVNWMIELCDREIQGSRGALRKRWKETRVKLSRRVERLSRSKKKKSPEQG